MVILHAVAELEDLSIPDEEEVMLNENQCILIRKRYFTHVYNIKVIFITLNNIYSHCRG